MQQDVNPLKKINLEQYQKPKTLIVVHYKGRRISVPLLGDCRNLTQILYHHIDKFQQTVMKSNPKWQILSQNKIVCFCSASNEKSLLAQQSDDKIKRQIQKYLKYSDGDLKIDLLLSMLRIQGNNNTPGFDVTKYYKYMQIQPFCIQYPTTINYNYQEGHQRATSNLRQYHIYRLLQKNRIKNVYLARSLQDGYFYAIKVYRQQLHMAQRQAHFLYSVNRRIQRQKQQQQQQQKFSSFSMANHAQNYHKTINSQSSQSPSIIPKTQIVLIPSQQQQDDEQNTQQYYQYEGHLHKYKYLSIISEFNFKGKLSDRLNINSKAHKISQKQLLKYLKQLIQIAYRLHQEYNVIHRNLTPDSFQIDVFGNLKLTVFTSILECYGQHGQQLFYPTERSQRSDVSLSSSSRVYEQQFQTINKDDWYQIGHYTPPEVLHKSSKGYNKLVDFYTIGVVIDEIYKKVYQFQPDANQRNSNARLVQTMIRSLTSKDLEERQKIVIQIMEGINSVKSQSTDRSKQISLSLNEISLGQQIAMQTNFSSIQNQENDQDFNGISHQEVISFFKPTKIVNQPQGSQSHIKKVIKKSKEKKAPSHLNVKISKSQFSNISNSRDKSVKSVKSNPKSKQKSRTKSKISLDKKQKSNSTKKHSIPQRASFNMTNNHSKLSKTQQTATAHQKKSKSKSYDKRNTKADKSMEKISKQKSPKSNNRAQNLDSTDSANRNKSTKINLTVPLPRKIKSPLKKV